jgi:uncharacterized membrane protein YdbT with pleckstrin-like domain
LEQPLDTFRSSTSGWLRGSLAGWGTIVLALAGILLCAPGTWGRWPLLLSAIALGIVAWKWLDNLAARYDLTEDRLIVRRGIFNKSLDEIELYRVKDIRLDFSLVNQLVGLGTICIVSSDETTRATPLVIRDVERAAPRREALRNLVDKARQKRRVREIDMVPEVG